MQVKHLCRLCLNKEGKFYKLFDNAQEECILADQLNSLLNFQIIKSEHLPESICNNCHKIYSFFKEFKSKCARVNDYFNQLYESQKCSLLDITIKTEQTDDLEDISVGDTRESNDEDSASRTAVCEETPFPVALITSSYNEDFDTLRSNFLRGHALRADEVSSIPESGSQLTDDRKGKKRKNDCSDSTQIFQDDLTPQDLMLAIVKTEKCSDDDSEVNANNHESLSDFEETDNGEFNVGSDAHSSDLNGARNKESALRSGSNSLNDSVVTTETCHALNLPDRTSLGVHKEASLFHSRKRAMTVPATENKRKRGNDQSSPSPCNRINLEVKQEEIDIYEPPLEEVSDSVSSDEQKLPDRTYLSDSVDSDNSSSHVVDEDSVSTCSSSEDSDEDTEMLLLLAMLM